MWFKGVVSEAKRMDEMFSLFMSHDGKRNRLIAKIENLNTNGGYHSDECDALKEKLAKMDGSRFNGHYHYHCVVKGTEPIKTGLSGAMAHGGFGAGEAYVKIMKDTK